MLVLEKMRMVNSGENIDVSIFILKITEGFAIEKVTKAGHFATHNWCWVCTVWKLEILGKFYKVCSNVVKYDKYNNRNFTGKKNEFIKNTPILFLQQNESSLINWNIL